MANSPQSRIVALLGRDDGARAQLRGALVELGAKVVVEAEPAAAQAAQVLGAGTNTVIVNLAVGVDDDLEHLQELFDSPQVNVIFNEAEVSGALEGWDLARWARHLAAKVLGHDNTLPPLPSGAAALAPDVSAELRPGAPPTPAQQTVERPIEEFVVEAEFLVGEVPENHLPLADAAPAQAAASPAPEEEFSLDFDLASLESALQADQAPPRAESAPAAAEESGLDFGDFDISFTETPAPAAPAPAAATGPVEEEIIDLPDVDLDSLDLPDTGSAPAKAAAEKADAEEDGGDFSFDPGDLSLDSLSFEEDASRAPARAASSGLDFTSDSIDLDEGNLLDDDVAALAASLDALEKTLPDEPEVEDFSLPSVDFDEDEPAQPTAPAAAKPAGGSFGTLSLASLDDAAAAPANASQPQTGQPAAPKFDGGSFGNLSLVSLDDDTPAAPPAAPKKSAFDLSLGSSLSLEPIPGDDTEVDPLMVAMGLVEAPAASAEKATAAPSGLRRVVVLGASIGGPDAVRSFLAAIPEGFPAVFLLVQHLENGYFERLAQQLQKSVKLPVGVLGAAKVQEGQVYVVPASARFSIAPDGTVGAEAHASAPRYTPSIDNLFIDVAARFGQRTTAIIFSGMAGDAIEGAAQVTAAGGEVWVQDPASCVVSSMVDGAKARGVVEFTGSPRELAEQLIARYGKA